MMKSISSSAESLVLLPDAFSIVLRCSSGKGQIWQPNRKNEQASAVWILAIIHLCLLALSHATVAQDLKS